MSTLLEPTRPTRSHLLRRVTDGLMQYLGVLLALGLIVVWLLLTQADFASSGNLLNVLETNASLLIISVGLTFVLLVGGFDLSVAGMLALSGVMLGSFLEGGMPVGLAIAIVLVGATVAGTVINGITIARLGLSFFVVTLGSASIFRGLALLKTKGSTIELYDAAFLRTIGSGRIAGIPWPVIIAVTIFALAAFVLRYTNYGRMIYAVGGNPEAARTAGINVTAVRASAYSLAAFTAAAAGIIETGRLASASPTVAATIELTAGAAIMVGGTSLAGGIGGVVGTLLGVLFIGVLSNGLTLSGVSSFWQGVVTGVVLILAVLVDRLRGRRR